MHSLKLLAALLAYPSQELVDAIPEIARRFSTQLGAQYGGLRPATQDALAGLLAALVPDPGREDLFDLQERYVAQFDAGRTTSLHLFEHIHGDSRDRGQAMVDLLSMYRGAGYSLDSKELPDYLPALLEFLSTRSVEEAHGILDDCSHILRAIGERLLGGGSPYAAVFEALLDLQGEPPLVAAASTAKPGRALDDDWQEAPVMFGPSAGGADAAGHGAQQSRPQFIRFVPKRPT